ncbi:MAG: diguanylate cyclase [Deltaproteobacteria bacterium]|nr:diguanylate cyclase [Deltaproteobacteria bacterium]
MQAKVLVVDDEAVARNLYSDVLIASGHQVRAVASASEALDAVSHERFDVVVTDLILPKMDGMQLLTELKRRRNDVEIIVVTALEKVEPAVRALKNGASDYLVKPLAPEVLQAAVARCLLTQRLMLENNQLRTHVELLEAGQKIATTLDRQALYPVVLDAVEAALQPRGAAMVLLHGGRLSVAMARGMPEGDQAELVEALNARQLEVAEGRPVSLTLGGHPALAFAARDAHDVLGAVVVADPARADASALSGASFLTSHVALALRNSGRMAAVEDLAYQDDLTHLFNTRYLHLVLEREIKSAHSTGNPLALLFLDLDKFKHVNDQHGHLMGSRLLCELADLLKECVREFDVVTRYGGDEFVILLLGADTKIAMVVAERIRKTVETHAFLAAEGIAATLTTSVGVASFPEHGADKPSLLALADRALYAGKRTSRNVVFVANPEELERAEKAAGA